MDNQFRSCHSSLISILILIAILRSFYRSSSIHRYKPELLLQYLQFKDYKTTELNVVSIGLTFGQKSHMKRSSMKETSSYFVQVAF